MSFISSIQSFLPRPDNRSRDQIEQDLEDEIAFHLECKTRALMAATAGTVGKPHGGSHLEREAASNLARKQFGDVEAVKNECRRIALKERIMLQRVNFVMMAVVLLVVIAVGAQVLITQRYNTLALQAITADMTRMKFDAEAKAHTDGQGLVYVDGDVARPGVYNLPTTGVFTLRRAIAAAGGANGAALAKVTVTAIDAQGHSTARYVAERLNLKSDDRNDLVLAPDDHVTVAALNDASTNTDARAKAIGEFVMSLFSGVEPNDPNLEQTIRRKLDDAERNIDAKYKDDPQTAGMIRELIAARRKIFDSDAAIRQAATAEAKAKALSDFLADTLVAADPAGAKSITTREVLDTAEKQVDHDFANNPEMAARLHDTIDKARQNMGAPGAATAPASPAAPQITPFRGVRWKSEWTPIVNVEGQWYELVSIDGIDSKAIIDHCRKPPHDDEAARKLFSEDLLTVLKEMQHPIVGESVKLQVKDLASGTVMAIGSAIMSAANHDKAVQENAAAVSAGKAYPVWE